MLRVLVLVHLLRTVFIHGKSDRIGSRHLTRILSYVPTSCSPTANSYDTVTVTGVEMTSGTIVNGRTDDHKRQRILMLPFRTFLTAPCRILTQSRQWKNTPCTFTSSLSESFSTSGFVSQSYSSSSLFKIRGGKIVQEEEDEEEEEEEEEEEKEQEEEEEYDIEEENVDEEEEEDDDEYDTETEEPLPIKQAQRTSTQARHEKGKATKTSSSASVSSSSTSTSIQSMEKSTSYDELLSLSPLQEMGITIGSMILFSKLNLKDSKMIRFARFFFIGYIVLVQVFLLYVRFRAKSNNDTTPITIQNPLNNLLQSSSSPSSSLLGTMKDTFLSSPTQENENDSTTTSSSSGIDMMKSIASSFLTSQSTIVEYDLAQAKSMNMSLLTPMLFLWFLHFKLGQVQPLFFQTLQGLKDLVMSPLFQVYILHRNLERPFPNHSQGEPQSQQEEEKNMVSKEQEIKGQGQPKNTSKGAVTKRTIFDGDDMEEEYDSSDDDEDDDEAKENQDTLEDGTEEGGNEMDDKDEETQVQKISNQDDKDEQVEDDNNEDGDEGELSDDGSDEKSD